MKKVLTSILAATMALSMLAGCGSKPATAPASEAASSTAASEGASSEAAPEKKTDYPKKQITITVPPAAGGGTDLLVRAMVPAIKKELGQNVVVVNKPGAGLAIGFAAGAADKPDGYSVTALVPELLAVPLVADVNFTWESFIPVSNVNACYGALTVAADAPYNTVEEFVAYAKEHPGEVKIGNSGIGGNWHILAAAFASAAGIEVNHIPFDGGGPAAVALAGGHVDAVPVSPQEVDVHVKSGKAKILCVFAPERLPELPDVPTAAESGYPDIVLTIFRGFGVPQGTDPEIVKVLNDAFQKALEDPEVTKFMETQNFAKYYLPGDEFAELMKSEEKIYKEQVEALGLKNKA